MRVSRRISPECPSICRLQSASSKATFSHRRRCGARRPTRSSFTGARFRRAVTSPRLSSPSCSLPNYARASLKCVDCWTLLQQDEEEIISKGSAMTQRATTSLSLHYQVKPSQKEGLLVEIKGMLDRCAKEPEFIMGILHETPERPNELVLHELWKGTRAEFDATQGTKPYRKAYIENTKKFLDKVDVEWNLPILEWGTNLTGLKQS